jgi:peroxiredoxin Q/BCP
MKYLKINVGDKIPEFSLNNEEGNEINSNDLLGKWVVLYFYPRDNTPGCTKEAVDFTKYIDEFKKLNCEVVGISPDNEKKHRNFKQKNDLQVILLADPEHEVLEKFGVWQLKKSYGRENWGVVRTTLLVDPKGVIKKVWENVRVKDHVSTVLKSLKELLDE